MTRSSSSERRWLTYTHGTLLLLASLLAGEKTGDAGEIVHKKFLEWPGNRCKSREIKGRLTAGEGGWTRLNIRSLRVDGSERVHVFMAEHQVMRKKTRRDTPCVHVSSAGVKNHCGRKHEWLFTHAGPMTNVAIKAKSGTRGKEE